MSRFRWPMHFSLLNNDCLWIFDELQLMGSGVSTSAQLAGLRQTLATFEPCSSVWMSATMDRSWLGTVDFRDRLASLRELRLSATELTEGSLGRRMTASKTLNPSGRGELTPATKRVTANPWRKRLNRPYQKTASLS